MAYIPLNIYARILIRGIVNYGEKMLKDPKEQPDGQKKRFHVYCSKKKTSSSRLKSFFSQFVHEIRV